MTHTPLGIYLHLPFCDAKCPYCTFYSEPGVAAETVDAYLAALETECRRRYPAAGRARAPATIYCGGGTPSQLTPRQLESLCAGVRSVFAPPPGIEWTVECNPSSVTAEKLDILKQAGVNRISLGIQSFDSAALRRLGRRHDVSQAVMAANAIAAAGFGNWNLDLMACVPGVGTAGWDAILRQAVDLAPTHLSVYALTLDEGARLASLPPSRTPPAPLDDRRQLRILHRTRDWLAEYRYRQYEISNYARRGRSCRHHLDFWQGGDYLGFGPGAVSRVGCRRRRNRPDLGAYLAAARQGRDLPHEDQTATPRQAAAERLIHGLRLTNGIAWRPILADAGLPAGPSDWPRPVLKRLAGQGILRYERGRIRLTARGFDVADAAALELWS